MSYLTFCLKQILLLIVLIIYKSCLYSYIYPSIIYIYTHTLHTYIHKHTVHV